MNESELRQIPVGALIPTKDNPRRLRNDDAFKELVTSIKKLGVLQPLIARPFGDDLAAVLTVPKTAAQYATKDLYDLRAGHRRLAAAIQAGLATVPVIVRAMDDREAMEITVSENLQREDLHPLEESRGIRSLLDVGWETQAIADRLGKTPAWVARRAKLCELSEAWCKAIEDPTCGVSVWPATLLESIARLPAETQDEVLEGVRCGELGFRRVADAAPPTAAELDRYLAANFLGTLAGAPWKLDDETLVPKAGACKTCTKHSGCQPSLFEGFEEAAAAGNGRKKKKPVAQDRCLDQACYATKTKAHVERRRDELKAKHDNVVLLASNSASHSAHQKLAKIWPGLLGSHDVTSAKKSERGAVPALLVDGSGAGTVRWVKPHTYASSTAKATMQGARKSGGKQDTPATPLRERRKQLTARRRAHVIEAIRALIDAVDFEPAQDAYQAAAAITLAFGTSHDRRGRCEYEYGEGGRQRKVDVWNELKGAQNMQPAEVHVRLLRSVLPVLTARIRVYDTADTEIAWPEAKRVADLLGIELKPLEAAAAAAIPEPKVWKHLKADGTPKKKATKAKRAKKAGTARG